MVSTGLAASQPFEAWFAFDKSSDPRILGYAVPAGTTIRLVLPRPFTPPTDLNRVIPPFVAILMAPLIIAALIWISVWDEMDYRRRLREAIRENRHWR
jgi:hypothetical protein